MWFKNLFVHRLPADWTFSAHDLESLLSQRTLQPCGPFDMSSRGWVAPCESARMVHTVNGQHLIALGVEQKLLPASIIRQATTERAAALAEEQGFPVGRRQMRDLRLRVTDELRERALTKRTVIRAWIDPVNRWFVVDAAGASRAEHVTEVLRDTLGSFAALPMHTARSPQLSMTAWLKLGDAPYRFSMEDELELQASDQSKSTVRYTRYPVAGKDIQAHLAAGMYPTKLGLSWNSRIAFVLNDKLQLKRIEFLDIAKDASPGEERDSAEQFDIDFTLMAGEFARLLDDIAEALGGENASPQAAAA